MSLGLGLGIHKERTRSGGSGSLYIAEYLSAAMQNRFASNFKNNASYKNAYSRVPFIVVGNKSALKLILNNWYNSGAGQSNISTVTTITEMSIEHPNGTVVPVTFSGARSYNMGPGESEILCDEILPSAFGVSQINDGDLLWVKCLLSVPANGNLFPVTNYAGDLTGSQCFFYDPAATTLTSTDVAGTYVPTGGTPVNMFSQFMPILIGKDISPSFSAVMGIGDSITDATADELKQGAYGRGYFFKSVRTSANVGVHSGFSMARSGISSTGFVGVNTKWKSFIKYCNKAIVYLGTNDLNGGGTVASLVTNLQTISASLVTGGIPVSKIINMGLGQLTASTDGFLTETNQTVGTAAVWQAGGTAEVFNTTSAPALVPAYFSAFIDLPTNRGSTDPKKWYADGTFPNRTTFDGIHPNSNGAENVAILVRPILNAL